MRTIPLAALQHYAFCPRQCALIHNEQAWAENFLTAQGRAVMSAVAAGTLAPGQGAQLLSAIGTLAKVTEIDELEARLTTLEARHAKS